jgi:phosphoribosylamine-glycine ligase
MKFVIATRFFAGLGFAMRLQDEGHEVLMAYTGIDDRRTQPRYELVGNGIVPKRPLADVMTRRDEYRDWYFVWDENHSPAENEQLRSEGFRVILGGGYPYTMEHDRDACLRFVGAYGLQPPPSFAFRDAASALRFVRDNPHTAYVYKPDEGENFETWLPQSDNADDANLELQSHLRSLRSTTPFILQERKDGVEANVEVWFVEGDPRFAFLTLESKLKLTGDLGDMTGCAFDFAFVIPLESRAVTETVGRLFPAYREMCYTGFGDANFVAARDGVWFFEKCERFGYNSHPNLLWTLNRDPLGQTLAAIADRTFTPNFSPGFGASVSMYMDHPASGKVVLFPPEAEHNLYFYDVYRDGDDLLTAGYYDNVLIATGFGYTIETAWETAYQTARSVKFPGRSFRTDGAGTDYPSSPLRRYEALRAMGFI